MIIKYKIQEFLWLFLKKIGIPLCNGCDGLCFKIGKKRRQMTRYVDEDSNYVFACEKCLDNINEYWEERWQDYYSGLL